MKRALRPIATTRSLFRTITRRKTVELLGRTPQQVVKIVLRVLTGQDTLEAACQRHRITPRQFDYWCRNFTDICRQATQRGEVLKLGKPVPTNQDEASLLRSAFRLIRAEPPADIWSWANDRLTSAWKPKSRRLPLGA